VAGGDLLQQVQPILRSQPQVEHRRSRRPSAQQGAGAPLVVRDRQYLQVRLTLQPGGQGLREQRLVVHEQHWNDLHKYAA